MIQAGDGEEGVRKAFEEQPNVIVMDIRMPKKDGMTALAELKMNEETRHIPIVMLSASIVDQSRALDAGARFFLTKPYHGRDLLATVAAAVAGQRSITSNHRVDHQELTPRQKKVTGHE
jgi:DNA-binding response OmpR family regulator